MYKLEITEEQAQIIQKSLDLYSRVLIGQFEEVVNVVKWDADGWKDFDGNKIPFENIHAFGDQIRNLKERLMSMPSNGSHGIHSPHVDDKARKAWDIQKVIRHKLAWDREGKDPSKDSRDSTMFGVSFDAPDVSSHDKNYKLPTISVE
jgi:hypothetical protein